ncbi:hypothetical protein M569_04555 [Genlisea aurea]|uniref:Uncharacterized protein n=1 Tax=Genlisea aurea TaxID=192259 RepID=S8CTM8_9LAMI|nr:hypothetical protein M569_04555 [Genlisea aurea]
MWIDHGSSCSCVVKKERFIPPCFQFPALGRPPPNSIDRIRGTLDFSPHDGISAIVIRETRSRHNSNKTRREPIFLYVTRGISTCSGSLYFPIFGFRFSIYDLRFSMQLFSIWIG